MLIDLSKKVAVVTGAVGGLGNEICRTLASSGARVVLADVNMESMKDLDREIKEMQGESHIKVLDVTKSEIVNQVFSEIENELGSVDILVNCAGVTKRLEPLTFPEDVFDWIININLKGSFLCAQAAARIMSKQECGKIINIASIGGTGGLPHTVAYCASKGGVVNMTRALALDLAKYNINVNAIAPALTKTKIATQVFDDKETFQYFIDRIPLKRLCSPEDVANAVTFLGSSAADFITGHTLMVDGGWMAG